MDLFKRGAIMDAINPYSEENKNTDRKNSKRIFNLN